MSGGEWLPIGCKKTRSLLKEAVESIGQASQTTSADSSPGPSALPSALMEHQTYQNSNTLHPTLAVVGSKILNATLTWKSGPNRLQNPSPLGRVQADLRKLSRLPSVMRTWKLTPTSQLKPTSDLQPRADCENSMRSTCACALDSCPSCRFFKL